jgi:hypothetical protein
MCTPKSTPSRGPPAPAPSHPCFRAQGWDPPGDLSSAGKARQVRAGRHLHTRRHGVHHHAAMSQLLHRPAGSRPAARLGFGRAPGFPAAVACAPAPRVTPGAGGGVRRPGSRGSSHATPTTTSGCGRRRRRWASGRTCARTRPKRTSEGARRRRLLRRLSTGARRSRRSGRRGRRCVRSRRRQSASGSRARRAGRARRPRARRRRRFVNKKRAALQLGPRYRGRSGRRGGLPQNEARLGCLHRAIKWGTSFPYARRTARVMTIVAVQGVRQTSARSSALVSATPQGPPEEGCN